MIKVRTILLLLSLVTSSVLADDKDWVLVTEREGIQVFRQDDDDSQLKTFRGVTELNIQDFNAIGALLDDYDAVASFMHMVSEIRDLKRFSPYQRDVYVTVRLPWPIKDRDAPLRVTLQQDPKTLDLLIPFVVEAEAYPEQARFVRIPQMEGYYRFAPVEPGKVEVTLEVVLDPGGALPAWLANIILSDIPYFTLRRLQRVINRPRFQGVVHNYYQTPSAWLQAIEGPKAARAAQGAGTKANASGVSLAPSMPK